MLAGTVAGTTRRRGEGATFACYLWLVHTPEQQFFPPET